MPEDDVPPEHIWLDQQAITEHFKTVRERYKSGTPASESTSEQGFAENEMTKDLMSRR